MPQDEFFDEAAFEKAFDAAREEMFADEMMAVPTEPVHDQEMRDTTRRTDPYPERTFPLRLQSHD